MNTYCENFLTNKFRIKSATPSIFINLSISVSINSINSLDQKYDDTLPYKSVILGTHVSSIVSCTVSTFSTNFLDTYCLPHVIEIVLELATSFNPVCISSFKAIGFLTKPVSVCKSVVRETSNKVCKACINCLTHLFVSKFLFPLYVGQVLNLLHLNRDFLYFNLYLLIRKIF